MTKNKQQYLQRIRSESAYPTYRAIIRILTILGYLLAALTLISSLVSGYRISGLPGFGIVLMGIIVSIFIFVAARFWKEATLILADIGDSVTEANAKLPQQQLEQPTAATTPPSQP